MKKRAFILTSLFFVVMAAPAFAAPHLPPPPSGPLVEGDSLFAMVLNFCVEVMDTLGAFGAGVILAVETVFPFVPSELVLPLAGFTAYKGQTDLWATVFWCTVGGFLGSWALYYVGHRLGRERARRWLAKIPLISEADVIKTEHWFEKYGDWMVFFGRMLPGLRGLISVPAGTTQMKMPKFCILTLAGSFIWNIVLILGGYYLGEKWELLDYYVSKGARFLGLIVLVIILVFAVLKYRKYRSEKTAQKAGSIAMKNTTEEAATAADAFTKAAKPAELAASDDPLPTPGKDIENTSENK